MKLINRYVINTLIKSILLILLILIGFISFIELANEMSSIGRGHYNFFVAIQYVIMILPRDLYLFFPMAGLIGAIIGLGLLAASSELVVMRATGVSMFHLVKMVMTAAFLLCVVMTLIGEGVGPMLYKNAQSVKAKAMYGSQALVTDQGLWMRMDNDFLRVDRVLNQQKLVDVTRYEFNNQHRLLALDQAASMGYERKSKRWVAHDVSRTSISAKNIKTTRIDSEDWAIDLDPKVLSFSSDDPMAMSLIELTHFIRYRNSVGLSVSHDWLIFWQRVFQPLATLVMIFLAVPFVFGSLRSGTMGHRILIGIVVGLVFYLLSQLTGQASLVYHIPPILSALLPILGFTIVGVFLVSRV